MRRIYGFARIEAIVVVCVAGVGGVLAAVGAGAPPPAQPAGVLGEAAVRARDKAREIKDSTHIRGIVQSLVIFAQNNQGRYPLPSALDEADATLAMPARAKDTTANLYSILVYGGFVPTEMFVSPAEVNPAIKQNESYEFVNPKGAAKPGAALWDPSFSADFTRGGTGHTSYAHQTLTTARLERWGMNAGTTPLVGSRGPRVEGLIDRPGASVSIFSEPGSNTLRIHGPPETWNGLIGLGDGSVAFMSTMLAPGVEYADAAGQRREDVLFFDEQDDPGRANAFLTITTHAGEREPNFRAIWD